MYSPSIQKLIDKFSEFPTVGPRTAARFVLYLIKLPQKEFEEFLGALLNLKKTVKICNFCFKPFELSHSGEDKEQKLCEICQNPSRNRTLLCVVEKETDLASLEQTKKYNGLYFILGGVVSRLQKQELKKLRMEELKERVKNPQKFGLLDANFKEILIATNPTTEGEATRLYLERILKPLTCGEHGRTKKITRLGRGLPVGGELEYADEETLSSALEGRK